MGQVLFTVFDTTTGDKSYTQGLSCGRWFLICVAKNIRRGKILSFHTQIWVNYLQCHDYSTLSRIYTIVLKFLLIPIIKIWCHIYVFLSFCHPGWGITITCHVRVFVSAIISCNIKQKRKTYQILQNSEMLKENLWLAFTMLTFSVWFQF